MTNSRSLALFVLFVVTSCAPDEAPHKQPFLAHRDALSTGVVISQVYGAGGNANATYNADFVELFNRGTTAVNVSNWSVQYTGATTAAWEVASLSAFGSLQPGKYILISMSPAGTVGSSLPTPNVQAPAVLMNGTAGKVALVNNSTALTVACPPASAYVDFVGYGGASCSETTPTGNLSSILSAQRKTNGCIETDNNSTDFTLATPAPRNNAVAAFSCSAAPADAGVDAGVDAGADAGRDAGPADAGCLVLTSWQSVYSEGGYQPSRETVFAELHTQNPATADGGSLLRLEAYFGAGLMLPDTVTFSANDSYGSCDICPILARGCDSLGDCAQFFFAQAGSATVTTATENVSAGSVVGSLSSVKFVEWDFLADEPVVPGQCVFLTTQLNVSWDAGTGTGGGGGGATGGGTGGAGGGATGGGTGGGPIGGGGGSTDGGVKDGGAGGGTGGGGGRGGFGGGAGGGGSGSADAGPRDAGIDAGSSGGGTGGGPGGGDQLGGGTGSTGGGQGGGGTAPSGPGCGCSSDGQALAPLLVMLLGAMRLRRRVRRS